MMARSGNVRTEIMSILFFYYSVLIIGMSSVGASVFSREIIQVETDFLFRGFSSITRRWAVMWRVVPTTAVEASSINFTVGGGGGI